MNNYRFCAQWILDRKYGKNVRALGYGPGEIIKGLLMRLEGLSWLIPSLSAFMLCTGLALASARVEAAYTVVELDANLPEDSSRVVRALNDNGEIVGGGQDRGRQRGILLGTDGVRRNIDGRPGSDHTSAFGINLAGQVVGSANTHTGVRAFRKLRTSGSLDLGTLTGDSSSVAYAINDSGESVGFSSGPAGVRAVKWSRAGAIDELPGLPGSRSSRALAISNRGDAVGISDTSSGPRAVLWRGGTVKELGALPGLGLSEAQGINDNGDIVGSSWDPETQQRHAVLWRSYGSSILDLGALPGGTWSRALGVSNRGQVVGISQTNAGVYHAFLWTEQDGMQDLNDHFISPQPFVLTQAVAISSPRGLILAYGWSKDIPEGVVEDEKMPRFYLLTPTQ